MGDETPVAGEVRWVTPTLACWEVYAPAVKCVLSSSAVMTGSGLMLIDPIALSGDALDAMCAVARPAGILLTNGNHSRAAASMRQRFGIRVTASSDAVKDLELVPDVLVADGDLLPGGMQVVAIPGAGPGEVAFVGGGIALIGDALIHLESHGFALLPAQYCADAAGLPNDLRKLLSYDFEIMTFAHGAPLIREARKRLQVLLA